VGSNSRFTVALHVLAWMALVARGNRELVTSEQIASSVNTNPVVIRRILGSLRDARLVVAQRGAGAGWRLARPPESITLAEVHDAVEHDSLFAMHRGRPNQACPVGRGIQPALLRIYRSAEHAVRAELSAVSIESLLGDTLQQSSVPRWR
jgi:Rrf2 family protein